MARTSSAIDIAYTSTPAVGREGDHYEGFAPGRTLLEAGHRKRPECRAFTTDTIWERDVKVSTRDGTILRADVFRPANSDDNKVPILLSWSPYGKSGAGELNLSMMVGRAGVPESSLSGYEKFEAPDPAEWVPRGYAIVEVDARGIGDSEGDVIYFGKAEGQDGYDAVEYMAQQPWCTGDVALVGNSWLAMAAYHIAAEQPPHLKCFAPLEGASDFFRETMCRGGVPQPAFWNAVSNTFSGRGRTEDVVEMVKKHPRWNEYWEDKRVDFSKVQVPAYILASFSSFLHTEGSCRCYQEINAPRWLTFHATQEWYDLYSTKRTKELAAFFDRYLKGIQNGWEKMPPVRGALLGYNEPNITDIALSDWPAPATEYKRLFLSSGGRLVSKAQSEAGRDSYQSDVRALQKDNDPEELHLRHIFSERTHLLGYSKAELYVSCEDHDDLDIFVQIRKADKEGNILRSMNMPVESLRMSKDEVPPVNVLQYLGPTGICRASLRDLDPELSKPYYPMPSLRTEEKIPPGTVVKVEIGIWPGGMTFAPGESLVLKISGHPMVLAEFPTLWGSHQTANKGRHAVHFGGEYPSALQVPFVRL